MCENRRIPGVGASPDDGGAPMTTENRWGRRMGRGLLLACPLVLLACDGIGGTPELYINEFMADNLDYLVLEDDTSPDWIEIYNAGVTEVLLDDIYLSDVLAAPTMWGLGVEGSIAGGGFLLLYADGETSAGHLPFKLDKGGEDLGLFQFDGSGEAVTLDAISYPSQLENQSSARSPDGGGEWVITGSPTPGESNG
jgi:large repetitive protein